MLPIVRDGILAAGVADRNLRLQRRRRGIRNQSNPFQLSEPRFIELFRLNKRLARTLINILRPLLPPRRSMKGISNEIIIFTALRFYATGSYQRCVGEEFFSGLSQTAVHRCVHTVTEAMANIAGDYISMPDTLLERNRLKHEIMERWGFPGTIGMIDGFHVAILKPSENEQNFINRKGYHSLNVQIISDHNLKIRNIFANFGGSTHDSFIWRASEAQNFMRNLYENRERSWLIGDSGYPLQPYLMTPFRNPAENSQVRFNQAHASARNCVERTIGLLKMRFRCILKERSARYSPQFMCNVVKACAMLHNMCIDENLGFEVDIPDDQDGNLRHPVHIPDQQNNVEGIRIRNDIINRYFN